MKCLTFLELEQKQRQLQLVEQEAAILRAKTHDLEAENEKVTSDNRRMALRLTRKGPPSDADKLHMEKLEREDKVKSLEKKNLSRRFCARTSA